VETLITFLNILYSAMERHERQSLANQGPYYKYRRKSSFREGQKNSGTSLTLSSINRNPQQQSDQMEKGLYNV